MGRTRDHFKKVTDIKGTFHAKKGMIKDRNCKDLIEEIKKRWQEYTEKGKESEVSHLCLTLCDPMDCNLPGSPAHGIFQARELECIAILFSRDLPNPGIEAGSPSLQTDALPFEPPGKQEEEYIEELYKKGLNDPDNHNGMVSHLEPDILECEVNWALGSITRDKTTGGDTIPAELFQILTNDAVQVLHSICQQI